MYTTAVIVTVLILFGLGVLTMFIPQLGTTTMPVSFSSPSRESARQVVDQIKAESVHIYNYEMKGKRTSKGEIYEVEMELRLPRGHHNSRILDLLIDFDNRDDDQHRVTRSDGRTMILWARKNMGLSFFM
jgi:putative Mg2+ transporter-C (MgtC) family protein